MNSKTLANCLLTIAALLAFLMLIVISSTNLPDNIWWYIIIPTMTLVAILDIIALVLLQVKETTFTFKPRFRYTKVLVILPILFLLTSCMTTNVCNLRNGQNKTISKSASASVKTHKQLW